MRIMVACAARAPRATWLSLSVAALQLVGCSLVLEPDKTQCKTDADCLTRFGEDSDLFCRQNVCVAPSCKKNEDCASFGQAYAGTICVEDACVEPPPVSNEPPEWLCLDEAPPASTAAGPFQVKMHLQHMVRQMPMKAVMVQVCRKLDMDCEAPESSVMSDDNGDVVLSIPKGFTGYVSLSRADLMPTQYFFNPSITQDSDFGNVQMVEANTAKGLAAAAGASLKEGRALVLFAAYNCKQMTSTGIQFASTDADETTTTFYSAGGLPSSTATETESSGFGGFINALPGNFSIEGKRTSDGRVMGRTSIQVKPNSLIITRLTPSVL